MSLNSLKIRRNACWLLRLTALIMNITSLKAFYVTIISTAFMLAFTANAAAPPKICTDIHKVLIKRQQGHEPKDFYIEYRERNGEDFYQRLDIDDDKISDSVIRSCGASIDSACLLLVKLSTGRQLELETVEGERFFLGRIKSSIYVIAGETSEKEKEKRGKRRIYQITKQAIKLICPHL